MAIFKDSSGSNVGVDDRVIIVDGTGNGDYTTVEAAIAYMNTLTIGSGERRSVYIRCGSYTIDNSGGAIQIKERIDIVGEQATAVFLTTGTAGTPMFTFEANGNVNFANIQFVGPASSTTISHDSTGATAGRALNFYQCKFGNMDKAFAFDDVDAQANFIGCQLASATTRVGDVTGGAFVALMGCQVLNFGGPGFVISGTGSTVIAMGCEILGMTLVAAISGTDCALLSSGSVFAQNTKVATIADTSAFIGAGNVCSGTATTEFEQSTATAVVSAHGIMNFSKMTIASGGEGSFNVSGIDSNTGEVKERIGLYAGASTINLNEHVIVCSTGTVTHTLPAITATTEKFAHRLTVINRSAGTVTLGITGGDTINGGATATIATLTSKELIGFSGTWFFA